MSKEQELIPITLLENMQTSGAGHDMLRYIGLPDLLGAEAKTLLYFMGKSLARKLAIQSMDDIYYVYEKLGWGKLELVKEKRKELIFHLMADSVAQRLNAPFDIEFRYEAGFLAEAMQILKDETYECTEEIHKKIHMVEFSVVMTNG